MNYRQANTFCRKTCREYGIKPIRVVALKFPKVLGPGPDVALGYWDNFHRVVEINRQAIHFQSDEKKSRIISGTNWYMPCVTENIMGMMAITMIVSFRNVKSWD
jgi:hypothetical protein